MRLSAPNVLDLTHFTLCGGIGGISVGLNRGTATVRSAIGQVTARMRCLGSIDSDPAACRDFERLTGTPATLLDLFDLEDFRGFHAMCKGGKKRCTTCSNTGEPPAGWRAVTPADIRAAAQGECPDILAWSPPCKGFSGLNAGQKEGARERRYLALNRLVLHSLVLALKAFADDLPALVIMENVPLIATSGRWLVDAVRGILEGFGYAVAETVHDCGELGGLAQHRKRFLMVGRNRAKVAPYLYEPPRKRVRAVGEVLGELPMPDDAGAGPMHRLPNITWETWVRLALIEAGKDWRSLQGLTVENGQVQGLRIAPVDAAWFRGVLGVTPWTSPAATVTASAAPARGSFAVADPRATCGHKGAGKYRVTAMDEAAGTVIGSSTTGNGAFAVADPRAPRDLGKFEVYGVTGWDEASGTVTSMAAPGSGHFSVADPRPNIADPRVVRAGCEPFSNIYRVTPWTESGHAVSSARDVAIADPRPTWTKQATGAWATSGHYGVVAYNSAIGAVVGNARLDKGPFSVADHRLPDPKSRPESAPLILALDNTWHRPLTTLELAALQGFPVRDLMGRPLKLDGANDSRWRMGIGNAVPPPAAEAIGSVMADVLLRQFLQVSFQLSASPIWVAPLATALSMDLSA